MRAAAVSIRAAAESILMPVSVAAGAGAIAGFLAAVSPMMHNFWQVDDEGQRSNEMIHFMKNLALIGGAILLAFYGAGPKSIDLSTKSRA